MLLDGDSLLSSLPLALTEARLQHLMVLKFRADPVVRLNLRTIKSAGSWKYRTATSQAGMTASTGSSSAAGATGGFGSMTDG